MTEAQWAVLTHRGATEGVVFFPTKAQAQRAGRIARAEGYHLVDVVPLPRLMADPAPYCEDECEAEMEALAR